MSLDKAAVTKIGKLSRIELSDADKDLYANELSKILKFMEVLQKVNTDGVPQMASVSKMKMPRRKDEVTDGHIRDAVLANAPQADYGCFVVPKVIGES